MLARYTDRHGRLREVLAHPGAEGSRVVVDRDAVTLCDRRLVAHLDADEPPRNAEIVCRLYLADPRRGGCRPLRAADLRDPPLREVESAAPAANGSRPPLRHDGCLYRLRAVGGAGSSQGQVELRWCRLRLASPAEGWAPVSLREVVERLERYEPARALTADALVRERHAARVRTDTLREELVRLQCGPVVLNRRLREAVVRAVEVQGLTLSEIATRCGRVKRDRRGRCSGETSWLGRRVGLIPEAGAARPVRWVHSDVLALIARRGLGVSPREVEVE